MISKEVEINIIRMVMYKWISFKARPKWLCETRVNLNTTPIQSGEFLNEFYEKS